MFDFIRVDIAWRYALRLTSAVVFVCLLSWFFSFQEGYWAVFAVITCVWQTQGLALLRSYHRVGGTFLGMIAAIALVNFLPDSTWVIGISMALMIGWGIYAKVWGYGVYIFFVTIVTVLMMCLLFPGNWQIAMVRLNMTLLGVGVAILASLFVLPVRARERFPIKLRFAEGKLVAYMRKDAHFTQKASDTLLSFYQENADFQALRQAFYEASYELGGKLSSLDKKKWQDLLKIYETLQLMPLYTPDIPLPGVLRPIFSNVVPLFKEITDFLASPSPRQAEYLQQQLNEQRRAAYQQRELAALDLACPSTSLPQHIQLTLLLDALFCLFLHISDYHRVPSLLPES